VPALSPLPLLASLLDVHAAWAWVVVISNGLAGAWALAAHWVPSLRTRALWWFTGFAQASVFVQVAVGVGLMSGQHLNPPKFHLFYGFVAIITVGILFAYRDQIRHRLYMLYGGGGLFMMGLAIRAMLVAHGAR
jgi:hypothetical protein